jgi:hypothetical protein
MTVFVSQQHLLLARVTCPRCQGRHTSQQCPTLHGNPPAKRAKRTKVRKYKPGSKPAPEPATVSEWYSSLYPLIRYSLRKHLLGMGASASQLDDMLANGLAFSWRAFQWAMTRKVESAQHAARIAGKLAAKRAITGREFASERVGGYVDALDARFKRETVDLGLWPAPRSARQAPWDTQDMSKVCLVIGMLPEHLRGVAFCLAANDDMRALVRSTLPDDVRRASGELTKREIAAYVGVSTVTLWRYIAELASCECLDSLDVE